MPPWLKDNLPDFIKEYAVQIAATATGAIALFLLLRAKWLVGLFRNRLSTDERTLLRWTCDSPGNSLIALATFVQPLAITVVGTTLNRERERWLLAFERLQARGCFEMTGQGVYRLRASAMAMAARIKRIDAAPHQTAMPASADYGQVIIDAAMEDTTRPIIISQPRPGRPYRCIQIGNTAFGNNGDPTLAARFIEALERLRTIGKVEAQGENAYRLSAAAIVAERDRQHSN